MFEAVAELMDLMGVLMDSLGLLEEFDCGGIMGVGNNGGSWDGFQDWFVVVIFGGVGGGVL